MPVDGWYEGDQFIHLAVDKPMFLAAITNWIPYKEHPPGTGFLLIVDGAGLADPADRRPVVFSAGDARRWMDSGTTPEDAETMARTRSMGAGMFEVVALKN